MIAQFIKSTGIIVATGYMWALVPEVITYGEHATGRRISGTVNAIIGIVFQLGMAIGLFIPNIVLGFVGFDKDNAVSQSPLAQQGILWLVAVIPAILLILAMVIISKYKLEDHVIDKINREIEERHSNGQNIV
jgi:GPH family glycoside/pentoside/hexuronide:cation symporter